MAVVRPKDFFDRRNAIHEAIMVIAELSGEVDDEDHYK